jgi:hypothetical protein
MEFKYKQDLRATDEKCHVNKYASEQVRKNAQ